MNDSPGERGHQPLTPHDLVHQFIFDISNSFFLNLIIFAKVIDKVG